MSKVTEISSASNDDLAHGATTASNSPSVDSDEFEVADTSTESDEDVRVLSKQSGAHIVCHDESIVCKSGHRVHQSEETAMRLVALHTRVPVPKVMLSSYKGENGTIMMAFVPGVTLKAVWDDMDDCAKERICREIWALISQWREIPRPPHLAAHYQCLADGSATTTDPLLQDLENPPTFLSTDVAVRERIYERYHHYNGRRYECTLPDMLPSASSSVFTHGDVAPRNIMVSEDHTITGILDWEIAGWYPDYWEYANIHKPSMDEDWQQWMERTAPRKWDISGIRAARGVLF